MLRRVLLTLYGNDIAPRFDLATEVMIVTFGPQGGREEEKTVVLPRPSAEALCHMIVTEGIHVVVCGGIEEEYLKYLAWKKISVLHSVLGPSETVLARYEQGRLRSGDILFSKRKMSDGQ